MCDKYEQSNHFGCHASWPLICNFVVRDDTTLDIPMCGGNIYRVSHCCISVSS